MDKRKVLSMLLDLDKTIDSKLNEASKVGIDLDQFIKEIDVTEIIEEIAGTELPYLPEMMQTWMRSGEGKEELINSILTRKNYE